MNSTVPWMEAPGGLQSMGSLRVGHDLATKQQKQLQSYLLLNDIFKGNKNIYFN